MDDVICSSEIEFYVDTIVPQNLEDFGCQKWLDYHQRLQKLNQQAIIEAAMIKDEFVKETFITSNKVWVLIHEALLVNVWKNKILPKLLELDKNPKCTFVAYSVLFHEAISVALLEIMLFHSECCETLGDHAADLLDYAYDSAAQLIVIETQEMQVGESTSQELCRQRSNLIFDIGIRCLSIIRYMAENLNKMILSISSRIYNIHDVPMLLVHILLQKPWLKDGKCFSKGKWVEVIDDALSPAETQVWLALRQLLLDPRSAECYGITEARRNGLQKLMPLLQASNLLDQVSPLMELNHWLCRLIMNSQTASVNPPLLLEPILELKQNILKQGDKRWKKLARAQLSVIFPTDRETLAKIAQGLSEAYNTDLLEKLEVKPEEICAVCSSAAIQRCSRCKTVWYCSRKCQVGDWEIHKNQCTA